jgi:hypothetical protein
MIDEIMIRKIFVSVVVGEFVKLSKHERHLLYSTRDEVFLHVEIIFCRTGIQKDCGSMNPQATHPDCTFSQTHAHDNIVGCLEI